MRIVTTYMSCDTGSYPVSRWIETWGISASTTLDGELIQCTTFAIDMSLTSQMFMFFAKHPLVF